MKSFRSLIVLLICSQILATTLLGQGSIATGLRIQKTPNLYYENGIALEYSNPDWWKNRIHLGASYTTSRLGSAMGSNALKQDNLIVSSILQFRNDKIIMPVIGLNLGYFKVDTEHEVFDVLPNSSLLLSAEVGAGFNIVESLTVKTTVGYNLITGDGIDGPGSLYPVFLNFTTLYHLNGGRK